VGISQAAVAKHVAKGVLVHGATARAWLHSYCDRLREQAAGRGSDEALDLTRARTREAESKARMLELNLERELGRLVALEDIEPELEQWASVASSEIRHAIESIIEHVESKTEERVDREHVDRIMRAALDAIASYPRQHADAAGARGGALASADA